MKRIGVLFACLLLLTGCGWHLRGYDSSSTTISALVLTADDDYSPLYRAFRLELERRQVRLDNGQAQFHLHLQNEQVFARQTTLSAELHPAEEELVMTVHYQILRRGEADAPEQTIQVVRNYMLNQYRAAANDNEKNVLLAQMRQEAIQQVLHQLELLSAQPAAVKP